MRAVWVRASLPRLRYDQLMSFGWKFLIEIAFLWVMVSAVGNLDFWGGLTYSEEGTGLTASLPAGAPIELTEVPLAPQAHR